LSGGKTDQSIDVNSREYECDARKRTEEQKIESSISVDRDTSFSNVAVLAKGTFLLTTQISFFTAGAHNSGSPALTREETSSSLTFAVQGPVAA
jgi:hypothetical protein